MELLKLEKRLEELEVLIDGTKVDEVKKTKFLDVIIDSAL